MSGSQAGKILNAAVIGCGEVAQIAHMPNLIVASDMYKITALCDISAQSLELCSKRFSIPNTFTSVTDLLASPISIDVVFILTADQFHAEHIVQCANAGKHIMIEKPMAQTLKEYDLVEEARVKNNVVIFVGYMRRYSTALQRLKDEIEGKEINYVRVRDIIGNNKYFTSQSGQYQKYFTDHPAESSAELSRRMKSNLIENLGEEKAGNDKRNAHSWSLLHSLASHDLSAMRDVLGMPERCLFSSRSEDDGQGKSWWWNAVFGYKGFKCYYEMGIDEVAVFDAHIEVYTNDSRVKIQYDTPYVKGLPIKLTIQKQLPNGDFSEQVIRPTYVDPYTLELPLLYDSIVNGKDYKTKPLDAKNDTILAKMIMDAFVE
ncbi:uncharacterized protein I303_100819 [Kwoniella dejecticola CBS 10117]|uniref:Myo-inositol 2-dehydrogenase n=1 Tax=Kwoniella dejecticola CBS 10117 TaxID=1296121 RepID=A0A1A6AG33_9TREE|nr:myo-inositol 2-dehydrogenase [Kwoniella dejecticola CBS 10117]OBR89001.1 myo-inositol 2-dehydrogenase [Kwoniella dejecticola CBS 10117]